MKKFLVMAIVAMMTALSAEAQTSLVGREYQGYREAGCRYES